VSRPGIDRINFRYVTLWWSISYAYGVKSYQMSGPGWLRDVRFDIVARGREGTVRTQLPEMMQTLLAERFKLKIHRESRELPALALTVGKNGPKLTEAAAVSGDGQGGAAFGLSMTAAGVERMDVKGATMAKLASTLSGLLGLPVVDRTGLEGRYDFVLEFSRSAAAGQGTTGGYNEPPPLPSPPPTAEPGLSIFSAVQQLGLRLDSQKLPFDVIVIDHAEKLPTEN
jgi:uncharacterized protein (TIGR03435 family)